ncbi:hypothetical protein BDW74DRAFT_168653 [Aspergillus multicolor]|uniref:uncharacterized protein n=1 Tax=Aspergillus multicolor TaxID=41759 RepID=UPI003CCD4997
MNPACNDKGHVRSPEKRSRFIYIPNTLWTRSFAIAVVLETLATIDFDKGNATTRIRSLLGFYIFALLYELALPYDALRRKNTFQLTGLCICNLGLFTYGILQMREIKNTVTEVVADTTRSTNILGMYQIELILVPVFLGLGTAVMIFYISADLRMNRRYTVYQVYITILKFDWIFFINAAMVPVTIIALSLSALFCRREKTKSLFMMMIFMIAVLAGIIRTITQMHRSDDSNNLGTFKTSLTLFAGIATLLIISTLVNSVWCMMNFQKGLKDYVKQLRSRKQAYRGSFVEEASEDGRCRSTGSEGVVSE